MTQDQLNKNKMNKLTANYKVVGLTSPASFTLYEQSDHCWAKSGLPEGKFKELFDKSKAEDGFWEKDIRATVECDGFGVHRSPINGVVTNVTIDSVEFV